MSYNILIVDDSVLTRAAIKRIIDMVDLDVDEVLEAENGVEAFKVLESKSIDVVLAVFFLVFCVLLICLPFIRES